MRFLFLIGLCLGAATGVSGCGGGGGGEPAPVSVVAPTITSQPASVVVSAGQTATFSITANGTAPLAYQWRRNGTTIAGATASSYTTPPTVAADNGAQFSVLVTNSAGSATSNSALLTVSAESVPPSVERQINATSTDSSITAAPSTGEAPHVAINPSASVSAQGKLLVFLPGTQGRPTQYTYILRAAATRGFHAVGVNYLNQTAMGTLCQDSPDPDCYWTARSEVIFGGGTPVSGQNAVTRADSIVNRLYKLLVWLKTNHSTEGWGQFLLANDTIDWSKVVLAGHSQGGGHVGVLAKTVALSRAIYFSSPDDWRTTTDAPANWTATRPNVTPSSQQYGFGSDNDTLVPNAHAFAHWDGLGLYKPASGPVLVDATTSPFSDSHQLRTMQQYNPASTAPTPGLRHHGVTVVDTSTPVDGAGKPLFDSNGVWAYLCFQ